MILTHMLEDSKSYKELLKVSGMNPFSFNNTLVKLKKKGLIIKVRARGMSLRREKEVDVKSLRINRRRIYEVLPDDGDYIRGVDAIKELEKRFKSKSFFNRGLDYKRGSSLTEDGISIKNYEHTFNLTYTGKSLAKYLKELYKLAKDIYDKNTQLRRSKISINWAELGRSLAKT